jgi:hypothetical protein
MISYLKIFISAYFYEILFYSKIQVTSFVNKIIKKNVLP